MKCFLLLLFAACAGPSPARVWQSHASTTVQLLDELRAMQGPFPDAIPWQATEDLYEDSDVTLWDFGYLACSYDTEWTGEAKGIAWFRRPAEVGRVEQSSDCAAISAVLRDLGVPCSYALSQGNCLVVPGRLWPRAVQGLQSNPVTSQAIAFVDAAARPAFDFYGACATSLDELQTELLECEQARGQLPDCVVAWDIPGWGGEHMDELTDEGTWWYRAGYQWGWCSLKPIKQPTGIGSFALFLRPRSVACMTTHGLSWALQELHLKAIPAHFWLSQGIYLDVPGRREREALRILHASPNRPANAGSLYPLK